LGATSVRFGITIYRREDGTTTFFPCMTAERLLTTKLGLGLILAAPSEPSDDDRTDLASMGYSVDEVAQKAIERNQHATTTGLHYPLPLSYRPTSRTSLGLIDRYV
jgi:hypothetical protein